MTPAGWTGEDRPDRFQTDENSEFNSNVNPGRPAITLAIGGAMKRCTTCAEDKPTALFDNNGHGGLHGACRACRAAVKRAWRRRGGTTVTTQPRTGPRGCGIKSCARRPEPGETLCATHLAFYRRRLCQLDRCECGNTLIGPYALERGTCHDCAYAHA